MVQRTNAEALREGPGGRESVGVMKGEVVSSILTGSTIFKPQLRLHLSAHTHGSITPTAAYCTAHHRHCVWALSRIH